MNNKEIENGAKVMLAVVVVDKYLLEDFLEYLIENYDIKTAKVRWITHGTSASHSFEERETKEVKLIQEIASEYADKKGFKISDVSNSDFINNIS